MVTRVFTNAEISARHSIVATAGICPDCEVKLILPTDMAWPHEQCPSCGANYLADYHPGYRRMIQSFPIPGEVSRDVIFSVLYDEAKES